MRSVFAPRPIALLVVACMLPLAGCPSRSHAPADAAALARTEAPLAWHVNHARVTHHLATSSLESRDALPGHQFVVLDVSVRNRDAQPQVLSEGKLIALDETRLQTFDQPETLLSDEYLSLQVLAPNQDLHGKIAYEVPEHLPGVLYWSPGNGSERILLNPIAPPASTLADAGPDDDADTGDRAANARIAPVDDPRGIDAMPSVRAAAAKPAPKPKHRVVASAQPLPSAPPVVLDAPDVASVAVDASVDTTSTLAPTRVPTPSPQSAEIALSPPAPVVARAATRPIAATTPSPGERELARRQACESLVARDDPADKADRLGFFATSCRDYALPEHWRPEPAHQSLLARAKARASSLLARVLVAPRVVRISDCSANASRADRLVCADPDLSAMDHQLAQSVARASDQVDDPAALQREQAHWRGRVRDACDTTRCLEQAYGRRIVQLDALAPMRP